MASPEERARRGDSRQGAPRARDGLAVRALHVAALSAFAFAQPLLEVLARDAMFFVVRWSQPIDVWILVLALLSGVPALLVLVELLVAAVHAGAGRALHRALIGALLAVVALPPLARALPPPGNAVLPAACAAGLLGAIVYARWAPARALASWLALGVPLFAGSFLLDREVRRVGAELDTAAHVVPDSGTDATVVVLLVDELPLGALLDEELRIDASLFPHVARLAAGSTWYRNATATHELTEGVMAALVTGNRPAASSLPTAADHPKSLFTLLAGSHRLVVRELKTNLCPLELIDDDGTLRTDLPLRLASLAADLPVLYLHVVLPEVWRERLPSIAGEWKDFWVDEEEVARKGAAGFTGLDDEATAAAPLAAPPLGRDGRIARAAEASAEPAHGGPGRSRAEGAAPRAGRTYHGHRPAEFRAFLDRIEGDAPPTLYFLHTLLPHNPWMFTETGAQYLVSKEEWPGGDGVWPEHAWRDGLRRHLLQLGHLDALLGELLDALEARGLYDEVLLVVVADHGVSFEPGVHFRYAEERNLRDLLHVPLFVKAPGQRAGRVVDASVESVDVLPIVAQTLGIELPWPVEGRVPVDGRSARATKRLHAKDGRAFEVDAELPRRWPVLERKLALLGGVGEARRAPDARDGGALPSAMPDPQGRADQSWRRVYAAGPMPELVGRRVEQLDARGAAGRAVLDDAWRFDCVELSGAVVPCRITGAVLGRDDPGSEGAGRAGERTGGARGDGDVASVAIAVNGVVQAVVDTAPAGAFGTAGTTLPGGERDAGGPGAAAAVASFAALVPASSFAPGANRVDLFAVRADGSLATLEVVR